MVLMPLNLSRLCSDGDNDARQDLRSSSDEVFVEQQTIAKMLLILSFRQLLSIVGENSLMFDTRKDL